jgi:CHAT domain
MIEVDVLPDRISLGVADMEIRLVNTGPGECRNIIFIIRLPVEIMHLRGQERITVDRLFPGQSIVSALRVRAHSAGCYKLTSPNFSYRDHTGRSHRVTDFTAQVTVNPQENTEPEAKISAELKTTELPLGEWSTLRSRIINIGHADVDALEVTLSGQITTENRSKSFTLDKLRAGASVDASFFVRAEEAGGQVPIYLDLAYRAGGRGYHITTTKTVGVMSDLPSGPAFTQNSNLVVKILFFGASPRGARPLRIDQEIREVEQTIKQGSLRNSIVVKTEWAVRPRDITQALLDFEPHFVQFVGHGGGEEGSFAAENDRGYVQVIPVDGLVQTFKAVGQDVQCVVVNACETERLAQALAAVVPCVIGMRQPVGDRSAIRFSIGFYQALAAGRTVETAFDVGVAQLMMTPEGDDAAAPLLLRAPSGTP